MEKAQERDYYVGLDIGTDSVGWAVTDTEYHVLRKKGRALWGVRLFDTANTAAQRRTFRTGRRRLQRRRQRILLLQELFAEEIAKKDPRFFQRLNDSAYWAEDKQEEQIYSLFCDEDYTDVQYHQEYPTIYHLRSALLCQKEPKDVRLVYLALHHLMKHRGHFLFSGEVGNVTSFHTTFQEFQNSLLDDLGIELQCDSEAEFERLLKDKTLGKNEKCARLEALCHIEKTDKQQKEIFKLIVGRKASISTALNDESLAQIEHDKISFSESGYEEARAALEEEVQEKTGILDRIHAVYSWVILADILDRGEYEGRSFLSVAKVCSYEKHHADLQLLKALVKKYCREEYKPYFSQEGADNYCAYVGFYKKGGQKRKVKRCKYDDFVKSLKKLLDKMPAEDPDVQHIREEIEKGDFLPLQVTKDNGVIPYQVNKMELEQILRNAKEYLPFLDQEDPRCRKTVSEKIVMLFEFRIPYYVGPLNTAKGENCWMIRREPGEIRPWNFEEKVDTDRSAEAFIRRMTNQCTYLIHEDVLPKYSLLYSEFMVLNELNNVKIRDEKLTVELKQAIVRDLFQKQKQVTGKRLLEYLQSWGYDIQKEDLSGFDGNFKSSLTSYLALKKIFGEELEKYSVSQMAENLILWITLYGEEPKMLRRVIRSHYGKELTEEQILAVSRLKFQGWGRLSRRFLAELEGADRTTGECMTILSGLRNTQNNLMQLLSQQYTFAEAIEEENGGYHITEFTYDQLMKDVVASPSVKRAIWQTVQIAEEIKELMGSEPKRIFVEMARGPEQIKERKDSRRERLLQLYAAIKDEERDWKAELERYSDGDFKAIKLYLYYTQMGKCMYTGEQIDLSQLGDANIYDRDHIFPQSKTKDDSLDNLVLVDRRANAKKGNDTVSPDVQQKMRPTWKFLLDKGLISKKKYERLTRTTPLTQEELAGFISRQMVETRQSSKVAATLLKRMYENTEIVYVKAKAVADFRQDEKLDYVKVRELNDYHHAKDAYLNIVVGNVYHTKFTGNPLHWLKEHPQAQYSLNQMFRHDLSSDGTEVWKTGADGSLKTVKNTLRRNDILFTRYAYCNKGELFNQMIKGAPEDKEKAKVLVPIKKGMETWKYGGYTSVTPAHFMLVESEGKKGQKIRTVETVPLYLKNEFEKDPQRLTAYCEQFYGLKNPRIILPCIKKNSRMILNGFPMHLKSSTGKQLSLQGAVQLCLDPEMTAYLKKVMKYLEENSQRRDKRTLLKISEMAGISQEENVRLYQVFGEKLSGTIYRFRPANPKEKLRQCQEKFVSLSLEEQCIVLGEILHLFQCKPVLADLTRIGGSPNTGSIKVGKDISSCALAKLINQSPTGIYEREIDLLKI